MVIILQITDQKSALGNDRRSGMGWGMYRWTDRYFPYNDIRRRVIRWRWFE